MNPTSKKFISLFLVFSLILLSVNLYAKERRGATIIIQRKSDQEVLRYQKKRMDGTPWEKSVKTGIWGELIAVKQDSLLLLGAGRKDVSIDIADIKAIGIVKKSQASLGAVLGFVVGASIGQLTYEDTYEENFLGSSFTAVSVGMLGGLIGLVIGAAVGMDKTIQIEGMTDSRIQETLDYLRKKARIRDYK